jgi:hypothetical protein
MILEYHPAIGQELEKIRDLYEEKQPVLEANLSTSLNDRFSAWQQRLSHG